MSRLDRMNNQPASSINLDGGNSSVLGVANRNAETLLNVSQIQQPEISTLITFSSKPDSHEK